MLSRKICLIGSFAVGKTSLVQQFVHSIFSDNYLSTIGVKISKKELNCNGKDVLLMLWDLEGKDGFTDVNLSYLRGAYGFFVVADCTRKETFLEALNLRTSAINLLGDVPNYFLINKIDLIQSSEITSSDLNVLKEQKIKYIETSAKSSLGVAEAFNAMCLEVS